MKSLSLALGLLGLLVIGGCSDAEELTRHAKKNLENFPEDCTLVVTRASLERLYIVRCDGRKTVSVTRGGKSPTRSVVVED